MCVSEELVNITHHNTDYPQLFNSPVKFFLDRTSKTPYFADHRIAQLNVRLAMTCFFNCEIMQRYDEDVTTNNQKKILL